MCHSGSHLVARYGARLPPAPPLVNSTSKRHLHYLKPVTLNSTRMPSLKPSTVTAFSHEFHTKEMSQGQPIKPQADQLSNQEGIKYGDVFDVTSGLASKTIAPRDVAIMLEAETEVLRKPLDTGANAVMYSAATANLRVGVVGPDESNEMVEREDVAVSKSTDAQGKLVVNEAIADHMVCECQYNPYDLRGITLSPSPSPSPTIINVQWTAPSLSPAAAPTTGDVVDQSGIAIREALEATILSVGDKPVEQGDAATIRVAKARAASSRNST